MLRFFYGGAEGVIRVAGLPMKGAATPAKIKQVRLQALLNVRDWLKVAVTSQVFSPGSEPLIGHLLVDGQHTVTEYVTRSGHLPQLTAPSPDSVVEGEFVLT